MELERFPGINIIVEEKRVIFELKIKNQKSVYMCHPFTNNTGGIAFVNSIKFLELWRNSKIYLDKEAIKRKMVGEAITNIVGQKRVLSTALTILYHWLEFVAILMSIMYQ